jgi:hypothetical protein
MIAPLQIAMMRLITSTTSWFAGRGGKSAITELHQQIGIMEGQLAQRAEAPSEAHVEEAITHATWRLKMEIETWKEALAEYSSGM